MSKKELNEMAEKMCHKLLNENLKCFCNDDFINGKEFLDEPKNIFDAKNGCSIKCEELCNNIQERLKRIRELIHLRSSTPNAILIDTLILIKQYIKEIKKYIDVFNAVIYEEKNAANMLEHIIDSVNLQNQNIEEMFEMFNKNIVITKNDEQIILKQPKSHCAFSENFVSNLLTVQGDQNQANANEKKQEVDSREQGEENGNEVGHGEEEEEEEKE